MITVESINKKIGFDFRQTSKLFDDWINDLIERNQPIPEKNPYSFEKLTPEEIDFAYEYEKKYGVLKDIDFPLI